MADNAMTVETLKAFLEMFNRHDLDRSIFGSPKASETLTPRPVLVPLRLGGLERSA